MNARKHYSASERGLCLSIVAAFGFFLLASAPHRVHHFFEGSSALGRAASVKEAHHHPGGAEHSHNDQRPQPTPQPDCFVLSVAQNTHASLVQPFCFAAVVSSVVRQKNLGSTIVSSFNLAPFAQRAPPRA